MDNDTIFKNKISSRGTCSLIPLKNWGCPRGGIHALTLHVSDSLDHGAGRISCTYKVFSFKIRNGLTSVQYSSVPYSHQFVWKVISVHFMGATNVKTFSKLSSRLTQFSSVRRCFHERRNLISRSLKKEFAQIISVHVPDQVGCQFVQFSNSGHGG